MSITTTTINLPASSEISAALKSARPCEVTIVAFDLKRATAHVYNRERGTNSFAVFNGLTLELRVSPKDTGRGFRGFLQSHKSTIDQITRSFKTIVVEGREVADHSDEGGWDARESLIYAADDRRVSLEVG